MAFIETTPAGQATGAVREMYERQQRSWGFVPNYAKVFCHRPEIMTLWAELLRGIRSRVDPRRFELVTLAAAHALRSSYCSLAHAEALKAWFTDVEIEALIGDDPAAATGLTNAEAAMMDFARKVVAGASRITAGDVAALAAHGLTDAEIFDVAAVASARMFFASLVESLGAEADVTFAGQDEALRRVLAVGRPIDHRGVERLAADAVPLAQAG
jgi:uncharacterized peroxidase-related enzyme